jgi:hypothetical protein
LIDQSSGTPIGTKIDIVNNTMVHPDHYGMTIASGVSGDVNLINNIIAATALNDATTPAPATHAPIPGPQAIE